MTETHAVPRDWTNTLFLGAVHALALLAVVYAAAVHFSWWTLGLAVLWFALCGLSITGGYHRLFSHRAYEARAPLRLFYLLFGAASFQNSALNWCADHRQHHARTDTEDDPYNIRKGFWWAHVGWVLRRYEGRDLKRVWELREDPLVRFQHRHYVLLGVLMGMVLPAALGALWGDALGALLMVGFLRLVVQWHATFSVNSFAHMIGSRTYDPESTARDSGLVAWITLGEGYHNFHHRFPRDYRNGVRWFHLDPTKWFIWAGSRVGLARALRRTPGKLIARARAAAPRPPSVLDGVALPPVLRGRAPIAR